MSQITSEEKCYIDNMVLQSNLASIKLRSFQTKEKNQVLLNLIDLLNEQRTFIKIENSQDIENAHVNGLSESLIDRLLLDDKGIDSIIQSLKEIIALSDPVGELISGSTLPNGLQLRKIRVPIGVVTIIYESRPNVTIDVGALTLKSSNAVILRGGKEAIHSNKVLVALFQKALKSSNLPVYAVQLVEKTQRYLVNEILTRNDKIDLVVPRGGPGLIKFVSENSTIPVIKHDDGICHTYVHPSAKEEISIPILLNAKTQKPSACNAMETLLIDENVSFKDNLLKALIEAKITLHGDSKTQEELNNYPIQDLQENGYKTEYLSLQLSIKIVKNFDHAIQHIQEYASKHSDCILAEEYEIIEKFLNEVDSAAVLVNSSTRFHDGGQFGFGAEVGISTGKLHTRGPMGLTDLTTSKFIVRGNGQIRP